MQQNVKDDNFGYFTPAIDYSGISLVNFKTERLDRWSKLILSNLSRKKRQSILVIGAGNDSLPVMLAKNGHDITIVNISAADTDNKREAADYQMPRFDEGIFDAVISRNIIWMLEYPEKSYSEIHRLLKSGGRLLVFDADWLVDCRDNEMRKLELQDYREYVTLFGEPPTCFQAFFDSIKKRAKLPLVPHNRPEWDTKALKNIGFSKINSLYVSDSIYDYSELILTRSSPLFLINAKKT